MRTPDAHLGVCWNVHKRCFVWRPLRDAENGKAVLGLADLLLLDDEIADGHVAADPGRRVLRDLLGALAAAELDLAAELAVLDLGLADDADLVAPVRVLDDEAVLHAGVVDLAVLVAEDFVALDQGILLGVVQVAAQVGRLRRNGDAHGGLGLAVLVLAGLDRKLRLAEHARIVRGLAELRLDFNLDFLLHCSPFWLLDSWPRFRRRPSPRSRSSAGCSSRGSPRRRTATSPPRSSSSRARPRPPRR